MNKGYKKQSGPVSIPVPGGKMIEEYFGKVSTGTDRFSVAHMKAPPGWSEPAQTPEFDEVTIMISGKMQVEVNEQEIVELREGESFLAKKGTKVRYSNPFEIPGEYRAVCLPAFDIEKAHRGEQG